jgi:hypothetical protein
MLTREGARLQVFLELRSRHEMRRGPEELVIIDDRVFERPWGWAFPWTTRGWLAGDLRYAIGGNGPCLINRYDGSMTFCPTCLSLAECIARYEASLVSADDATA